MSFTFCSHEFSFSFSFSFSSFPSSVFAFCPACKVLLGDDKINVDMSVHLSVCCGGHPIKARIPPRHAGFGTSRKPEDFLLGRRKLPVGSREMLMTTGYGSTFPPQLDIGTRRCKVEVMIKLRRSSACLSAACKGLGGSGRVPLRGFHRFQRGKKMGCINLQASSEILHPKHWVPVHQCFIHENLRSTPEIKSGRRGQQDPRCLRVYWDSILFEIWGKASCPFPLTRHPGYLHRQGLPIHSLKYCYTLIVCVY